MVMLIMYRDYRLSNAVTAECRREGGEFWDHQRTALWRKSRLRLSTLRAS